MTAESLTNPTPADLLAWAERNPERVKPDDVEALRAAVNEAAASAASLAEAQAGLDEARRRLAAAQNRHRNAPYNAQQAATRVKAPHALAVLPDVVAAMVADGWADVTHAVVAVPSSAFGRGVSKPPAAGAFAALAQSEPGAKTISLRLLRASTYGMGTSNHELRHDDFAIVGWPRKGCGLLNPEAARAALGIPEPKAKKGGAR